MQIEEGTKATAWTCSEKKVFLSTCSKGRLQHSCFPMKLWNFQDHNFYRTLLLAGSEGM